MAHHPPMLAVAGDPTSRHRWLEWKFDGHRTNVVNDPDGTRLVSRGGHRVTDRFPEVAAAVREVLGGRRVELDGELVAPGEGGVPDFDRLQARARATATPTRVAATPVTFVAFDLLALDGVDVTGRPLHARRALLDGLALDAPPPRTAPFGVGPRLLCSPVFTDTEPAVLLEVARARRVEGIVAKAPNSVYTPGRRSKSWLKTVLTDRAVFTVVGFARGRSRHPDGIGSLLLARPAPDGALEYAGEVGTGWTRAELARLTVLLHDLVVDECPVRGGPSALPVGARLVRPELHGMVAYREHRPGRLLRHASWKGLVDRPFPSPEP